MKNVLTATLLLVGTIASASVFAADSQPYNVKVFNLDNEAVVHVTQNGQPVNNVAVDVSGANIRQTYKTSDTGTVFVRNHTNVANSLKISIQEPNGQTYTTSRFLASYQ